MRSSVVPSEGYLSYPGSRKAFLYCMLLCRAPQGRLVPLAFNIPVLLCLCQKIRLGFQFYKKQKSQKRLNWDLASLLSKREQQGFSKDQFQALLPLCKSCRREEHSAQLTAPTEKDGFLNYLPLLCNVNVSGQLSWDNAYKLLKTLGL